MSKDDPTLDDEWRAEIVRLQAQLDDAKAALKTTTMVNSFLIAAWKSLNYFQVLQDYARTLAEPKAKDGE